MKKYITKSYEEFLNEIKIFSKKIKPINYMYHISNPFFRKEILKNGLKPKIGDSYSLHYDENPNLKLEPVIFAVLTKDKATKENNFNPEGMYDSTYDDDIYEIDYTHLKNEWFIDPDVKNGVVTYIKIDPKYLKLIYKGK